MLSFNVGYNATFVHQDPVQVCLDVRDDIIYLTTNAFVDRTFVISLLDSHMDNPSVLVTVQQGSEYAEVLLNIRDVDCYTPLDNSMLADIAKLYIMGSGIRGNIVQYSIDGTILEPMYEIYTMNDLHVRVSSFHSVELQIN